jgi:hypothetical protein
MITGTVAWHRSVKRARRLFLDIIRHQYWECSLGTYETWVYAGRPHIFQRKNLLDFLSLSVTFQELQCAWPYKVSKLIGRTFSCRIWDYLPRLCSFRKYFEFEQRRLECFGPQNVRQNGLQMNLRFFLHLLRHEHC